MKLEQIMTEVEHALPPKRWKHTLGVRDTAVELAATYGVRSDQAVLAALLHDVAKYWPTARMAEAIREEGKHVDVLQHDSELWHAHAGAIAARHTFGVDDEEVLAAIRYHTSGREAMSLLDKVIWLADLIEPGRDFKGVEAIRALAASDLDAALLAGFDTTIGFLLKKKKRIYPLTVLARNALIATRDTAAAQAVDN